MVRQRAGPQLGLPGGRCRKCKAPISIRYPIVEILTMLMFLLHLWLFAVVAADDRREWPLPPRLVVLFAIDLEHHLLPNAITLPGIVVGLIVSLVLPPGIVDSILGTLLGGGVLWAIGEAYYRYSGQEGMGGGDVKMLAMIGAFRSRGRGRGARPAVWNVPGARRARGFPGRGPHSRVVSGDMRLTSNLFREDVMIQPCRRFLALDRTQRGLVIEAAGLMFVGWAGVRLFRLVTLRRALDRLVVLTSGSHPSAGEDVVPRVRRAVNAVAARIPAATCLVQALAAT